MSRCPDPKPGRRGAAALACAGALLLAACESDPKGPIGPAAHRPQIEQSVAVHPVRFRAQEVELSATEASALQRFLASRHGTGKLYLQVAAPAPADRTAQARRDAVLRAVRGFGLRARPAGPLAQFADAPGGDVLVRAVTSRAVVSDCPDLTRTSKGNSNQPTSNYGCASMRNLGLMLANPADLDRGRALGRADGERASRAVRAYRQGKSYTPILPGDAEGADAAADSESGGGDYQPSGQASGGAQ
jgi:pilus assembly protein CpaD